MDLKAHIQAARRAPLPVAPVHRFEIDGGGIADDRRRSAGLPTVVLASAAALTLLWLVI